MKVPKQLSILKQEIDLEKAIADALERILAPVAEVICEMERIRRKEYLTEKEVALLFSLSAATLKTQRSRSQGPKYIKIGKRVLYSKKDSYNTFSSELTDKEPTHHLPLYMGHELLLRDALAIAKRGRRALAIALLLIRR